MKSNTVIVDYGVGNLRSVARAFEFCGAEATISSDPKTISLADRVVLPGVGAFGDCMSELKTRCLRQPLLEFTPTVQAYPDLRGPAAEVFRLVPSFADGM